MTICEPMGTCPKVENDECCMRYSNYISNRSSAELCNIFMVSYISINAENKEYESREDTYGCLTTILCTYQRESFMEFLVDHL